jgi:hypothetical protein
MQGRDTGSSGQKKAGEYIVNFYKNNNVSHPPITEDYYQKIPASF